VYIPAPALVREGEKASVWVVAGDRAQRRAVEAGPEDNGRVEIRGGLEGGESVVLRPPPTLKDGARVRVAAS